MPVRNYKLTITYDGTDFRGWQVQPEERTVQGDIEGVFRKILSEQRVNLIGSGRTDSGVHANAQVASIKIDTRLSPDDIRNALNANLKNDVRIQECMVVDGDFHARYSARSREYAYHITREFSPFIRRTAWWVKRTVDFEILQDCAIRVVGEHDFTAFCKATAEVNHKNCIIYASEWEENGPELIYHVRANRFLQHMVRYLVGTMVEVARGRFTIEDFNSFLKGGHPQFSVNRAPAQGLFLRRIYYD